MNNTRLEVLANPLAPKGELPFVRFAPGNGWSIQTATIKGCHMADLADAVTDYNRAVSRKVEGLNVGSVETLKHHVSDLPGWGDAIRDEMNARYAGQQPEPATKANKGAFDDDDTATVLEGPPSDDMRDLLEQSTVLHACPHGNAMLALPRSLHPQFIGQLVDAIKADNVPAVRVMLTTAGLMK
jgi:hypothetical protein